MLCTGSKKWYAVLVVAECSMIKQALYQHSRIEEHQ